MARIIYQALVKPILPLDPPLTKWFQPLSEPARRKPGQHPSLQQFWLADTKIPTEATLVSKWFTPLAEPVRVKSGLNAAVQQTTAGRLHPIIETVTLDKWYRPFTSILAQKAGVRIEEVPSMATGITAEPITPDKWFEPFSTPVWARQGPKAPLHPAYADYARAPVTATVATSVDRWLTPLAEPVRSYKVWFDTFLQGVATPEQITLDKWYEPWAEPMRRKVQLADYGGGSFVATITAEPTLVTKWFEPLAEPVRVLRGLSAAVQQTTAGRLQPITETVTLDKWYAAFADPVRPKPQPKEGGPVLVRVQAAETVNLDKWWTQASEPVWQRRALGAGSQRPVSADPAPVPPPPVFGAHWFQPLSEPIRVPRRLLEAISAGAFWAPQEIAVTTDIWTLTPPVGGTWSQTAATGGTWGAVTPNSGTWTKVSP